MLDKKRGKAYREIRAGCQYHQDEKLSRINFGFQRGSKVDCRKVLHQIFTWIKREFDFKTEWCRVENWENTASTKEGDNRWRVHVHMIWNAPYIKQQKIREKVELYVGENANVFIELMSDDRKAAGYMMQYMGYQKGQKIYFTCSRGWLPKGYRDQWGALKQDLNDVKAKVGCDQDVVNLASRYDDAWRKEVLVEMMGDWVERQRVRRNYDYEEGMAVKYGSV